MSASSNGGPGSPSSRENDAVREDPTAPSTSGGDSAGRPGLDTAVSIAEAARVSPADEDKPVEARVPDVFNESTVLRAGDAEIGISDASGGDTKNRPIPSISRFQNKELKKTKKKKVKGSVDDYDSMLSEFDQFAAEGANEDVGHGYEIGDMVWGKVKSHPWWPGHIYNEAHASPSVQRSKREGHVLVAFFGDSSYGWYDPAELIPFEENFAEKSRQTSSRPFLKAVGEAVDELSRRRGLGLACRCRNEFNFWPSGVEDYFVVDVGDYEPVVYYLSQINKARKDFHPNEMLSFVKELALTPMAHQQRSIEFIKNKATALACRRALFEEFDETYAQAFGTIPQRPPRPTAPVAVNPSKAPLSGRLVTPEALGKKKYSIKPTKTKDEVEKDKYIFKRRDEPIHIKTKKTSPGQSGPVYPLLVDGSGLSGTSINCSSVSDINDAQRQSTNQASMVSDTKPLEGSKKLLEGKMKKPKLLKRRAGELSAENATLVLKKKKRKKEISTERPSGLLSSEIVIVNEKKNKRTKEIRNEVSMDVVKLPLANNNSEEAVEKVLEMPLAIPLGAADNQLDNQKNDGLVALSSSSEAKRAIDLGKEELPMLLKDLHALAINPFHEVERSCQATALPVFLKYRSLVYQKSLVLLPPVEIEKGEADSSKAPSTALHVPTEKTGDKSTMKLKRTLVRPDDPTIGGRKRDPSIRPDAIKKKRKLDDSEDINRRKKLIDSEDIKDIKKKKMIDDSKLLSVEKKTPHRSNEPQRGDVKEIRGKNVFPASPKVAKVESGKRMQQPARVADPTMLVMKFPPGAALPSGAHLRAKFARFGPLDHSATRVFWETYTCRLVYQRKADAEAALEFAIGSGNLFGSRNVRSYIREVRDKAAEVEPVKFQKEEISATAGEQQRPAGRHPAQTHQQLVQLKSCLKKPSNEEVGNGNGRGTRVKFILGGEGGSKAEQLSSYPEGASYTHSSTDVTSKFTPESIVTPSLPAHQLQKIPVNMPGVELLPRSLPTPKNDISQQLLNLLTRCRDVVNNLTGAFGYVPYHSL